MSHEIIDKPWEHPERGDWSNVLSFMVTGIRAEKTQAQVVEETSKYINDNGLDFLKTNIGRYYTWLCREIAEESQ